MSATEAIVQFIGIVMLTASVPNDPGVHAIVPRIERRQFRGVAVGGAGVETHTAVILYQKADKLGISNWTPTAFQQAWEYVVLKGERLQFVTSAVNGASSIPRDLPHACPTMTLQSTFQGPDYASAAAVVDIAEGSLDVCIAKAGSDPTVKRADTRLFLKTNGSFVIVATKSNEPARTITFVPTATVYIANIPPRHLGITMVPAGGLPHHTVYDTMGGTSNCTQVPDISNICRVCETSPMKTGDPWNPVETLMINSECSNTQWP